ncbi:TolC family protein [Allorhodopirellula solitaria]|nr:TolC family protein [Allorhodopirellula solitaria]
MNRNLIHSLIVTAVAATHQGVSAQDGSMTERMSVDLSVTRPLSDSGGQVLAESELPPLPKMPGGLVDFESTDGLANNVVIPTHTLESVLAFAAGNNPTIRQARLHVSAEMSKALQAGLYPNPVLMYVGEKINSDGTAGEFQGFEISQRFVTRGKLRLSRQKYRERAHVAEHLAIAQTYRVTNEVEVQFIEALAASMRLGLQRELEKTAEDGAVTTREQYNLGQANLTAVRRANVMLQKQRLERMATENEYHGALRRLSALVGAPLGIGPIGGELRPSQALDSFDDVLSRLVLESPEVLAARAKLRVDQTTVHRERVQWIPDITIQGGPGYNYTNNDDVYNAAVKVDLPIYDRNQGTIRQACQDLRRQQFEIQRLELHLKERLASAYRSYATALQHATEYDQVVIPELRESYRQLLVSYQDNRIAWPDVLEGQRDYFQARMEQIDQFKQVRQQETMINGYLLDGGLMAAAGPVPPGHIDSVAKPR